MMIKGMELLSFLWLLMNISMSNGYNLRLLARNLAAEPSATSGTFNVKDFGARANGLIDDSKAFVDAWKAACGGTGAVKLLIPSGTYLLGPVEFNGPCSNVQSLTVQLEGTLKAVTDLNVYKTTTWVQFGWVDNMVLTGGGTFDGQGEVSWPFNKCPKDKNCKLLPNSLAFIGGKNIKMSNVKLLNSKMFHMALTGVTGFRGSDITITAPETSPNTDGIHLDRSTDVQITKSTIGTGDDCISIGHGNSQIEITSVNCGPGHGISVGSLGQGKDEKDVRDLIVKDCTLTGTDNGVRIKSWESTPGVLAVQNMTFKNIIMKDVLNPIIIDQTYCPLPKCDTSQPSKVSISDVTFKNIQGTSNSLTAVLLDCSKSNPCKNVKLENVHLTYTGTVPGTANATCNNVKATYVGTQIPPPCA